MSSKGYATPLVLRPASSWRLLTLSGGVCLAALLLLIVAPLPVPVAAGGGVWLALWGSMAWRRFFGAHRIVEAVWKEDGEWVLRQRSGREVTARLAPDTFFRPWLVVLNFRAPFSVPALVLFSQEPDEQTHRRLRVRLRLYQAQLDEEQPDGLSQRVVRLFNRSNWQE